MGCASSRQKRCRHCKAPYSPVPRSFSMQLSHPPQQIGDTYHLVALTSTTLGSIAVASSAPIKHEVSTVAVSDKIEGDDIRNQPGERCSISDKSNGTPNGNNREEFLLGLIEAKTWSRMIEGKIAKKAIPKTPLITPPGEPEMINTWEIMEGLEDLSPLNLTHKYRSFSFSSSCGNINDESNKLVFCNAGGESNGTKPLWLQMVEDDDNSKCPDIDAEALSTFQKAFQELSPTHPFHLKPKENGEKVSPLILETTDGVIDPNCVSGKLGKEKVVLYFTTLRGVRKTYEDCCHVRMILKGLGVKLDERDVSMHSGFKEELRILLGDGHLSRPGGLPRVFIGKKYVGGADEIRRLHEEGILEKLVEGCETVDDGGLSSGNSYGVACTACGDIRFVPCETCSGSCKVFHEEDEEGNSDGSDFGFHRCPDCNENGLVRCSLCCD